MMCKILLLLCAALPVLSGCDKLIKPPEPALDILLMVDISKSVARDHNHYRDICTTFVRSLPPNTRLIVGEIADLTEARLNIVFHDTLPSKDWFTDPNLLEEQRTLFYTEYSQALDSLFKPRTLSNWTNIVSVFSVFAQICPDTVRQRTLIILSVMLHSSNDFDLETTRLDDQFTERMINQLRGGKRLPKLHGAEIYAVGATAADETSFRAVRAFWTAIIRETGAKLNSYGYSSSGFDFTQPSSHRR